MRLALVVSLLVPAVLPAIAQTVPTTALTFQSNKTAPDRLIIRLKKYADQASVETVIKKFGAKTSKHIGRNPTYVISVPARQRDKLKAHLIKDKRIDSVELDRAWRPTFVVNDPLISQEWHLNAVNAPTAWNTTRGAGLTIAILDTGLDATHPEFVNKISPGWNTFDDSANTTDMVGHGTWVAGTAVAAIGNMIGGAGLAGDAHILPIKITDADGYGYSSTIADGLAYAAAHGAKIANVSFEIFGGDSVITDAAKQFFADGGLVFAAAGNDGVQHVDANNPYIVSVGSTAQDNTVSTFSSFGPYVDIVSPGEQILTTALGGQYAQVAGTSFASPLAAAEAALVWTANPNLNNFDVIALMKQTARLIDIKSGVGLIDAGAAVTYAASLITPTPLVAAPVAPTPIAAPISEPTPTITSVPITTSTPNPIQPPAPITTSTPLITPVTPIVTSTPEIPYFEPPSTEIKHTDALGREHVPNLGQSAEAHKRNALRKAR